MKKNLKDLKKIGVSVRMLERNAKLERGHLSSQIKDKWRDGDNTLRELVSMALDNLITELLQVKDRIDAKIAKKKVK